MLTHLYEFIYPLFSVWIIAGYLHLLHCLYIFEFIRSRIIIFLLFLPVLALEYYFSLHFPLDAPAVLTGMTRGWVILFVCRSIFWFTFFVIWVIFMTFVSKHAVVIKFFITQFYSQFYLLFRAERWFTVIALMVWLILYYLLTVENGMLRITTAMILPVLLSLVLLYHLYHFGGIGGLRKESIFRQGGVEKFLEYEKIGSYAIPRHPRGIHYDEAADALFVMFGATYGKNKSYPTIIRRDLKTGRSHAFLSRNIRRIAFDNHSRSIFVAPWYEDFFFKLSMDDLKIIYKSHHQLKDILQTWEPMDVLKDLTANRIYIGNDAEQALIAYDSETGKLTKMLNLLEQGEVKVGGPVWQIRQSHRTRKIYFISGPGYHLFEVDPDTFKVVKKKRFNDVVGTSLEIDDDNGLLYYQNGGLNSLYAIDMESFEIKRTYKGECHARRIRLDKKRNCIYVLGYLSGTVFPVDLSGGRRPWKIHVGGLPHGMDLHNDTLWVNSMAGVLKLDLKTLWGSIGNVGT
jgi:hypothetical protein